MLRILLLFLILRCAAATSEDTEGTTSGDFGDEEADDVEEMTQDKTRSLPGDNTTLDKSQGAGDETVADWTMVIVIAAASVVALAVVAVGGIILFRRYLRSREQGVYSMPAEQGQKAAV
ncbi:uncharacterized protein si:dkey-262k9.2 [Triplophysa rosa]|uniref:uncharacterized protein si:dkey-262k9.2 n=1 Tax=Triplophysa rosa TaxID=992332 RepID=UPI002545D9EA|nr:uncharacterized protein si:dkey-262k9.2 [Triplophysa rosa]